LHLFQPGLNPINAKASKIVYALKSNLIGSSFVFHLSHFTNQEIKRQTAFGSVDFIGTSRGEINYPPALLLINLLTKIAIHRHLKDDHSDHCYRVPDKSGAD